MTTEVENENKSGSEQKAIFGAFAIMVGIAIVWMGFFFGILQPWMDSYS